jgi:hypothetical protein
MLAKTNLEAGQGHQLLCSNGLKCCGANLELAGLLGGDLFRTADSHMRVGNEFLIVPSLPRERTLSRHAWLKTALVLDESAGVLGPLGMRVGYHNHTAEFRILDEDLPWDIYFSSIMLLFALPWLILRRARERPSGKRCLFCGSHMTGTFSVILAVYRGVS